MYGRLLGTLNEVSDDPTNSSDAEEDDDWLSLPPLRFPYLYLIFVGFSSADVLLTWIILKMGGDEVNPIAKLVISAWGLQGAIGFKFALTLFVVVSCEVIYRVRPRTARSLILVALAIAAFPPMYSIFLLLAHRMGE